MKLEKYTSDFIDGKAKFNFKLLFVWVAPLLPALILFIVNSFSVETFSNQKWINQALFWIFVPIILWSLFTTQKNNLVGNFGEAIILLIPTLFGYYLDTQGH